MIWTIAAVVSWCMASYMLPLVAALVWVRRHNDREQIIQLYAAEFDPEE